MPKKKGRRKKNRTHVVPGEGKDEKQIPRSFVIRRGDIPKSLRELVLDMRRMMMPHTAMHLKERKRGKMKDYFSVAGKLGISHFWLVSCTERGGYIRIGRFPRGPTLTFKIESFAISRDVYASQRRPTPIEPMDLKDPPLLVLNNFANGPKHVKVMATVFENMFPKLDVNNVVLSNVRRVILVDYDSESEIVSIRHFLLRATLAGLSKTVRSMVVKHKIPNLTGLKDIADIAENPATGFASSDSEGEGPEESQVLLPQNLGKNKRKGGKTSLRLREVGPRLSLKLLKVEENFCDGAVFYHAFIHRTEEQIYEMQQRHDDRRKEKEMRRKEQEENVRKKAEAKSKKGAKKVQFEKSDEPANDAEGDANESLSDDSADSADVKKDNSGATKMKRKRSGKSDAGGRNRKRKT